MRSSMTSNAVTEGISDTHTHADTHMRTHTDVLCIFMTYTWTNCWTACNNFIRFTAYPLKKKSLVLLKQSTNELSEKYLLPEKNKKTHLISRSSHLFAWQYPVAIDKLQIPTSRLIYVTLVEICQSAEIIGHFGSEPSKHSNGLTGTIKMAELLDL